jgi:hypothetical protein
LISYFYNFNDLSIYCDISLDIIYFHKLESVVWKNKVANKLRGNYFGKFLKIRMYVRMVKLKFKLIFSWAVRKRKNTWIVMVYCLPILIAEYGFLIPHKWISLRTWCLHVHKTSPCKHSIFVYNFCLELWNINFTWFLQ